MKKLLFLMSALFALNLCTQANASNDYATTVRINTYYGEKASSKANNPCKGATIRKCGEIEAHYVDVGNNQTQVVKITKDANGNIIATQTYTMTTPDDSKPDFTIDPSVNDKEYKKYGDE